MTKRQTTRIVLAARPHGAPRDSDFRTETAALPALGDGQVLLETLWLSIDPYMRGRMSAAKSYAPPVEIGGVMGGGAVGRVVESRDPRYAPGDVVLSSTGWQTQAVADAAGLRKLDPAAAPVTTALGVLGMPGFTAYAGLLTIGQPKPGETFVVAAATGAVGAAAGQIARIKGCRVVGIAGGEEKRAFLEQELGFDVALDHRAPDFAEQLKAACPAGIDIYFENVGGHVWEAVFPLLNRFARVPVCGLIAHYNDRAPPPGPDRLPGFMREVLTRRLTIRGYIILDLWDQFPAFLNDMTGWLREGRVRYREDIVDGLEAAPAALAGMLEGRNFGKLLVRVAQ